MAKRYFTVDEANGMVPRLAEIFGRVMQLRAQLKVLYKRLEAAGFAPKEDHFPVVVPGAPPDVLRDRATFKGLVEALREELLGVTRTGCVLKDPETGLVDWLARKDGRDIFLCWRYGEKAVSWWHPIDAGFRGRRPVSELEAPPEPGSEDDPPIN